VTEPIPEFNDPQVRGEPVIIIGPKPAGWTGLGAGGGEILVIYPDGEQGAVLLSDISEGTPG
jgi:hypothetical protein